MKTRSWVIGVVIAIVAGVLAASIGTSPFSVGVTVCLGYIAVGLLTIGVGWLFLRSGEKRAQRKTSPEISHVQDKLPWLSGGKSGFVRMHRLADDSLYCEVQVRTKVDKDDQGGIEKLLEAADEFFASERNRTEIVDDYRGLAYKELR